MRASIKLKLAATFTIVTAPAAILAWLAISSLGSLNADFTNVFDGPVARLQRAEELRVAIMTIAPAEKNMIMASTPEEVQNIGKDLVRRREIFLQKFEALQDISTEEVRQKLGAVAEAWVKWTGLQDRERELMEQNRQSEAKVMSARDAKAARDALMQRFQEIAGRGDVGHLGGSVGPGRQAAGEHRVLQDRGREPRAREGCGGQDGGGRGCEGGA